MRWAIFAFHGLALAAIAAEKPNVVVILADDLGYETLGCNGGTSYRTPALDALAAGGVRFTHGFAQPLCTPTRVQLMTGLSNVRNYINFGTLDPKAVTFAHHLKKAGYATAVAGKWQLGTDPNLPKTFGFEEHCLWHFLRRNARYTNPGLDVNGAKKDYANGEYGPDVVSDFVLDFIERKKAGPFFVYYPMMLTHGPYQPPPGSKAFNPNAKADKDGAGEKHFGAMVEHMDALVGKLTAKLETLKLREKTLIVFLGDNGTGKGTKSQMGSKTIIGGKGSTTQAGMHVPYLVNWPARIRPGVHGDLVDSTDVLPTILDAAGVTVPEGLDGRSFLPQCVGGKGTPREWLYSWYSPRQNKDDAKVREFAFTRDYKLYRTGEFYHWSADPAETKPRKVSELSGEAAAAAKTLQAALDQFKNARPEHLN